MFASWKEQAVNVQISGKQVDLGEALRTRIADELQEGIGKYFQRDFEANVVVSRERVGFSVDCLAHLASGFSVQASGQGADAHLAFDDLKEKLEKRLRRYKRRLKNHHADERAMITREPARSYVIEAAPFDDVGADAEEDAEKPLGSAPVIIAETTGQVKTMTVSAAVLELELSDNPALLFKNAGTGGLNMVYRRPDGHIGWVDPQGPKAGRG